MEKDTIVLQQKIIHFKSELAKYKEKVKDYQENYHYALLTKLKKENAELLEEKEELMKGKGAATEEAHRRVQGLETQLTSSRKRQEALQEEAAVWKEKAERYQMNVSDLTQHLASAKKEGANAEYRLQKKEKECNDLKIQFNSSVQDYEEKASANAARIADLSNQNDVLIKERQQMRSERDDWKRKFEEADALRSKKEKECGTYIESLEQAEQTCRELKSQQEDGEQKVRALEQLLNEKEREENKLRSKNESQASRLKNSLGEKAQLQKEMKCMKEELEKRTATSVEMGEKLPVLQETVQKLQAEKSRLVEQEKANVQMLTRLKAEKEQVLANIKAYEQEHERWQTLKTDWEEQKKKLESEKAALVKQNAKYKEAFSEESEGSSRDMSVLLDEQMKNILGQTFEYEEELDSKIVFMKSLEQKIEQLGNEILDLEAKQEDE